MGQDRIAIVGIGLTYPDARSANELWENVLAGRRAFRDIPQERTSLEEYWSADSTAPDQFYSRKAAVLADYEFDRIQHKVSAGTFRATDLTHWLALDVAGRALADAGFDEDSFPAERTGCVIGNTLTGEFSRASLMRLRWPYVRRTVAAQLRAHNWNDEQIDAFVAELEPQYKQPFAVPSEDTLAGGLANTIAGRICNYFDLGGGGYTVDGACSSSLLSVTQAATALAEGSLDVAIAGGVDLSIDPFELVGFARTGALAKTEMKVYDAGSNGFWPGEGCGMIVLMRESEARAQNRRIYACVTGWGVSSDGKGGITRPEAAGHKRAIDRAYSRAGYSADTVGYFEGHGTGTAVGDETEIRALASTRADSTRTTPAALGTIKGNIGHTKAAAGVAGLIKAALAVHHRTIPPVTGQFEPHPALAATGGLLYTPTMAEAWPADVPVRAGVSAMGFGGINSHIALEQADLEDDSRPAPSPTVRGVVTGRQDSELFLLGAEDHAGLQQQVQRVQDRLAGASMSELTDIAAAASVEAPGAAFRAAVTAVSVEQATTRLAAILQRLEQSDELKALEQVGPGAYVGQARRTGSPGVGFVFPGQGAGTGAHGAILRRFGSRGSQFSGQGTEAVQPRIVSRSLDVLDALTTVGVKAQTAVGHSLGEITALVWASAMTDEQAVRISAERGACMNRLSPDDGAMAVVNADHQTSAALTDGLDAVVSGHNAPEITVVAGRKDAVTEVCERAQRAGLSPTVLGVDHAFHTADFLQASTAFKKYLDDFSFSPMDREVISSATGTVMRSHTDLAHHLAGQMVHPVCFMEAVNQMSDLDLVIEVGPGSALSGLVSATLPEVVVTRTDSDSNSLQSMLESLAAAHTAGCDLQLDELHRGRLIRPADLDHRPTFLANPCEAAPDLGFSPSQAVAEDAVDSTESASSEDEPLSTIDTVRSLIAQTAELPVELVNESTKPLDELHLSSITIGQIANDVVRMLGRPALSGVPSFATASVREIATMLDEAFESNASGSSADETGEVAGAGPWVRPFEMQDVSAPLPSASVAEGASTWSTLGAASDDPLASALRATDGAAGLLVDVRAADSATLLTVADEALAWIRTAREAETAIRLVVLQAAGRGLSGLAKTLHLEHPGIAVTLLTLPSSAALSDAQIQAVCAEVSGNDGFTEATYTKDGDRTVPRLTAVQGTDQDTPLTSGDVLLATGGAKGITAEACLRMAQRFGVSVAMLGRSAPDGGAVADTLQRLAEAGVTHHYVQADVQDPTAVRAAISELEARLGSITAVLHGAGMNNPKAALELEPEDFTTSISPKVDGLHQVLEGLDLGNLKLLVGFASIIGRGGLFGEGHYATANDWLTADLEQLAKDNPHIRVRSLEWSVWTGAGMGDRLGVVERLRQQGIEPIGTQDGLHEFERAIATPDFPVTTVICARTGQLPTLRYRSQELPLSRYVERSVVHYPGVELVAEVDLSPTTDLYLPDHELDGELLLPAVMGMEAMAQVAHCLVGDGADISITDVTFERPIIVPADGTETVRICGVADPDGEVRLVVRTQSTDFGADHFRATIRVGEPPHHLIHGAAVAPVAELTPIEIDPHTELYGSVMFQGGRFQKITGYQRAAARAATVEIDPSCRGGWFAQHLPGELLLGDPGARDALMHSLQCCVPNATLLPHSVERIDMAPAGRTGPLTMVAREREGDGKWFVYDITLRDKAGAIVEEWLGLRLRAVSHRSSAEISWTPTFLGPYLERQAEYLLGGQRDVIVEPHPTQVPGSVADRRKATTLAARRAAGADLEITYRGDGQPQASNGAHLSSSHSDELTITTIGQEATAVDTERVKHQPVDTWRELLGEDGFATAKQVAAEAHDDLDSAATRVWSALECLRKVGRFQPAVHLGSVQEDGWVRFTVGSDRIATWVGQTNSGSSLSVAILAGG